MAVFCPECGTQNDDGAKFCKSCGRQLADVADAQTANHPPTGSERTDSQGRIIANDGVPIGQDLDGEPGGERLLWQGSPAFIVGPIAKFMNRFKLTNERLIHDRGFITKKTEMVDLYRLNDVVIERGFLQRLLGIGNLTLVSSDPSTPRKTLPNIGDPQRVGDMLRQAARAEEHRRRVYRREDV